MSLDVVAPEEVIGSVAEGAARIGRYRGWCVTLNNPAGVLATGECLSFLRTSLGYAYAVAQLERAETGTLHLQAYFYFANAVW